MKYTLLYIAAAALTILSLGSCKSDDDNTFSVAPTGGVSFHAVPGGAVMNYQLPSNTDIKDIRVRYTDAQGKENIVLGSYLCDSLSLGGFNGATQNVPAYVSYVNGNGDISEEYATTFSTADSGPYAFGSPIIVDMKEAKVPASVRIYTQLMAKETYSRPVWNGMSWTCLPCDVTVFGSNDKETWTELSHYSESDEFTDNSWFNVNHTVQRMNVLTSAEMDEAEPVYMDVTCPVSDQTYRYLKVVPNKSFSYDIQMFANTSEYIYMQEMEVYTKK